MANSTTQFGGFLTNIGIAQQANSAALGVPWNITHMLIGDAGGDPSESPEPTPKPTQTALVRQVLRAQLNALYPSPADPAVLVAELVLPPEVGGWWIRELALEDANGNFVAVAKPAPSYKPLLAQGSGRTQTIRMHVVFGNVANINLKIDPSIVLATREYVDKAREAAELYTRNQLKAHTDAANPHPQYLLRSAVAKDSGPLAWLGDATGTANALTLALKSAESTLTAYAAGQRFQFKATANNTGPVTAKIGGLAAVAVKKSEGAGLVDLVGGDIRAGALYDLNFDGTYFQLGGGVGGGKAFERFSFEASVAQAVFPARHTVGSIIVLRNGREVTDYVSDGETVTLTTPCEMGDSVQILAFSSFKTTDTYTKAELQALLLTASALPVGGILPFPRGVVPAGYLELDGSVQKIATFPDLAAYLAGAFNKGDEPAGYFRLPDGRGEFLRGWDHGRGVDAGRAIGSFQKGSLQSFDPNRASYSVTGLTHTGDDIGILAKHGLDPAALADYPQSQVVNYDNTSITPINVAGGVTRPRNLAVMWCIKAWNAPVNQGQIDIGALVEELTALRSSTPVGAILPFPKAQVPAGYLELDGSVQSAAAYPDLAAYLGTTFNKGDEPAGYFRLPDSRGEFLRGWDHGRGIDVGRVLGSWQAGQIESHDHLTYSVDKYSSPATLGSSGAVSPHSTGTASGIRTGMAGGSETRPRNLAVMWCIKAWNAPVNQGNIDIAALAAQVAVAVPKNYRSGFDMAVNAGSPTTTIDVAPGITRGSGSPVELVATTSGVLQASGAWSAGSGGNKLDAGVRQANSWYHLFVLRRILGGEADLLFSLSRNAPVVPAGYELVRRLGSIRTDASGNILPFINKGRHFIWHTPPLDVAITSSAVNGVYTISVPPGAPVMARLGIFTSGGDSYSSYMSPDTAPILPGFTSYVGGNVVSTGTAGDYGASESQVMTNDAAAARFSTGAITASSFRVVTYGWEEL